MSEERAKYGHEVFKSNMVTPGAVIVGSFWHSSVVTIELFADDLTEEAKKKFKDKSVWNENWDTFPLAILEFDNEDEE